MCPFPNFLQQNDTDCGPTCLRMIAVYKGINVDHTQILSFFQEGRLVSLKEIISAAGQLGLTLFGVKTSLNKLLDERPFPCIVHWHGSHYVVLNNIVDNSIYVSDPAMGTIEYSFREFLNGWIDTKASDETKQGIALLIDNDK